MAKQNDTIELNGYRYDARTGERLGRVNQTASPQQVRSVDGFARRPSANLVPKKPTPSNSIHSKITKSKTLRRQGLQKPALQQQKPSVHPPLPAVRSLNPNPARLHRASQAQKSPHIAKFQAKTTTQPMEIKAAPAPEPQKQQTQATQPIQPKRSVLPLSPFDMALQSATSHEQPAPSKLTFRERFSKRFNVSPRALSASMGVFAVLVVGGFFAKQHMSTLAVQVAATRAGVEAKLPSYQPSGFNLSGPIEYSSGQIAMSYKSNSDARNFKIIQKNTDWNSQALLENFVRASDQPFQTVQDKGKTIYIYEGNNATWVSGGVWYQVEGESSLNTDQLLRIASGL